MSVAYERPVSMRTLIDCLLVQTDPRWDLIIMHDGIGSDKIHEVVGLYNDLRVNFYETPYRMQQFGHPMRKAYLDSIDGDVQDFILMTNDDNYYVPVFVELMLKVCNDRTGFVYCDAVHSHFQYDILRTEIKVDRIDVGSFMVRSDVARKIGFNHFEFNGDGMYAEECANYCRANNLEVAYIPKCLFIHN